METGVLLREKLDDCLPFNDYFEYYGPDYRLQIGKSNMPNANSKEYLNEMCHKIFAQLDDIEPVPGVQIQTGQATPQSGEAPAKPLPILGTSIAKP